MPIKSEWTVTPGNKTDECVAFAEALQVLFIDGAPDLCCVSGYHRLVRRSPFDTHNRRHTSFVIVSLHGDYTEKVVVSYVLDPYQRVTNHETKEHDPDVGQYLKFLSHQRGSKQTEETE